MNDKKKIKAAAQNQDVKKKADYYEERPDFIKNTWLQYSVADLGQWVSLFLKRAFHRTDQKKRAKDIFDASQYLKMMSAHVRSAEENSTQECKEELERLNNMNSLNK